MHCHGTEVATVTILNLFWSINVHHLFHLFGGIPNHLQTCYIIILSFLTVNGKVAQCSVLLTLEVDGPLQAVEDDFAQRALNNFTTELVFVPDVVFVFEIICKAIQAELLFMLDAGKVVLEGINTAAVNLAQLTEEEGPTVDLGRPGFRRVHVTGAFGIRTV